MRTKFVSKENDSLAKFLVYAFLLSSYLSSTTTYAYLFCIIMFISCFIFHGKFNLKIITVLFLLFVFQYLYFLLGVANDANIFDAIYNFAGFYLFIVFGFFFMNYDGLDINDLILKSLLFSVPIVCFMYLSGTNYLDGNDDLSDISLLRRMFLMISFIYIGLMVNYLTFYGRMHSRYKKLSILILLSFLSVITSFSKVAIFLTTIIMSLWFLRNFKLISIFVAFFLVLFVLDNYYIFSPKFSVIFSGYDIESSGNQLRSLQIEYLFNDISFFGKGLGSYIDGFSRRTQGYGIELTYFNLLHKYGFFSIVYLTVFLAPMIVVIFRWLKNNMSYWDRTYIYIVPVLIASFMNPMLSAPLVIFIVAYWWVNELRRNNYDISLHDHL
ncbi:hypothetical protein [Vibrio sp. ZF 223]|uniref:hypothetical protein n=1 Tax=Vibrio sp. ZF 223 TaxID=2056191 RepID=UPI000D37638C|nr:hypothetical protein [Vibrio sp. ZF 223]PTQ02301.1 hypothetical protein CWO13_16210 [Vibrio sp. ZF 223]